MRTVQFTPNHLREMRAVEPLDPEIFKLSSFYSTHGPCLTVMGEDDEILACGGLVRTGQFTGEGWAVVSEKAKGRGLGLGLVKTAKDFLAHQLEYLQIVTVCLQDGFEEGRRVLQILEFEPVRATYDAGGKLYHIYQRGAEKWPF